MDSIRRIAGFKCSVCYTSYMENNEIKKENSPKKQNGLALGVLFGIVFGIILGPILFSHNGSSLGIGLGIALGISFGAAYDYRHK